MLDFLRGPTAQMVIWLAVLACLISVGVYVVLRFRGRAVGNVAPTSDMLANFREMAQQGDINETEFRTIKTMLGAKLQGELGAALTKEARRPGKLAEPAPDAQQGEAGAT